MIENSKDLKNIIILSKGSILTKELETELDQILKR